MTLTRIGAGEAAEYALAWADLSTGTFRTVAATAQRVEAEIAAIEPSEIVVAESLFHDESFAPRLRRFGKTVRPEPQAFFDGSTAEARICRFFSVCDAGRARPVLPGRAFGSCRADRLSRQDPAFGTADAGAARAGLGRHHHGNRPGDPVLARTHPHAFRQAAGIAAGDRRPDRHRRWRAAADLKAGRAAHRPRRHRGTPGRGGLPRRRSGPSPRASQGSRRPARLRAGAVAAGAFTGRPARSCRRARLPRRRVGARWPVAGRSAIRNRGGARGDPRLAA